MLPSCGRAFFPSAAVLAQRKQAICGGRRPIYLPSFAEKRRETRSRALIQPGEEMGGGWGSKVKGKRKKKGLSTLYFSRGGCRRAAIFHVPPPRRSCLPPPRRTFAEAKQHPNTLLGGAHRVDQPNSSNLTDTRCPSIPRTPHRQHDAAATTLNAAAAAIIISRRRRRRLRHAGSKASSHERRQHVCRACGLRRLLLPGASSR